MVDTGTGTPIVLIPGLQGRWEWLRSTVTALAARHRVITFSLCDEPSSRFPCDPAKGFANYLDQIDLALERARLSEAVIAGVSYGGLIAAEYAARRPERITRLVLASALHRSWTPDPYQRKMIEAPLLAAPAFVVSAPVRLHPEVVRAIPSRRARWRFQARQGALIVSSLTSPVRMASRIRWALAHPFAAPRPLSAPPLLLTGEPELDHVVPVDVTRRYLDDWPEAEHVVLPCTGHLGCVTRPAEFAQAVGRFVDDIRRCA